MKRSRETMARPPKFDRNPERSRRRLLDAAIRLFAARGFHGVSVDQIVVAARINKRMVYHYFGSKEAIYQAALHEVYSRIQDVDFGAVAAQASAADAIAELLRRYFAFLDETPEFTQFLLWENVEHGRHVAKISHFLSKNPFVRRFRATVEEGIAAGELRRDLDVTHLLIHCIGLCFIYHSNRFSLSQSLKLDLGQRRARDQGLQHVLALVLDGVRPGEASPRTRDKGSGTRDQKLKTRD